MLKSKHLKSNNTKIICGIENICFDRHYDYAILIGFHGMNGRKGVFCHTLRTDIKEIAIENKICGEITLFSKYLEQKFIPVIAVCGAEGIEAEFNKEIPFFITKDCKWMNQIGEKTVESDDTIYEDLACFVKSAARGFSITKQVKKEELISVKFYNKDILGFMKKAGYKIKNDIVLFDSLDSFILNLSHFCKILNQAQKQIKIRNIKFASIIRREENSYLNLLIDKEVMNKSLENIEMEDIYKIWKLQNL